MDYLSLEIPGYGPIEAPPGVPVGGAGTLGKIITVALSVLVISSIILALFFLVWGGILWIISRGDKQKLDAARKTLIYAIVGLIVIFLALAIMKLVGDLLGIRFF